MIPDYPQSLLTVEPIVQLFVSTGFVLLGAEDVQQPVKILHATGTAQSFIFESVLPFSERSYIGCDVLTQGIELGVIHLPLHSVYLKTNDQSEF